MDLSTGQSKVTWQSLDSALHREQTHVYESDPSATAARTVCVRLAAGTPQSAIQSVLRDLTSPQDLLPFPSVNPRFTVVSVVYTHDVIEIELAAAVGASSTNTKVGPENSNAKEHSIRARELREMTGIRASTLAAGFGVSREQYQRWISGKSISATRNGQLVFWHGLANEIQRKLGLAAARIWWKTPCEATRTPEQMFLHGDGRELYDQIVRIPEPDDSPGSEIRALPAREWGDDEPAQDSPGQGLRRGI